MFSKILDFFHLKKHGVKDFFIELFLTPYVRIILVVIFVTNIVIWVIVRKITVLAGVDNIALHYNIEKGIDLYGAARNMYILPTIGLFVFFLNFLIFSIINNKKDRVFIAYILLGSAFFVNIILVISIISLYMVNFGQ